MEKGQTFEHLFRLSADVYEGFLGTFADTNPLHVNDEFAQGKGFDQKVMHGNILCGFLSWFIGCGLPVENVVICSQQIKFSKPVYLGNSLLFTANVDDVFESVGLVELSFSFQCQQRKLKVASGKIQICLR